MTDDDIIPALPTLDIPLPPMVPKTIIIDKEFDKSMKLASKALAGDFRLPRDRALTSEERKEMRREQQRQRRASKSLCSVLL